MSENSRLVLRPGTSATQADDTLLAAMMSMGFPEEEARDALIKTGNRNVQVAIDVIMQQRDANGGIPPPVAAPIAPPVASGVPPVQQVAAAEAPVSHVPQASSPEPSKAAEPKTDDKLKSTFDTEGRAQHALKEQEELAKQVKKEQAAKKVAQNKIKLQLAQDKMIRRMKPMVKQAPSMQVDALEGIVTEIREFLKTSGPSDELSTILGDLSAALTVLKSGEPLAPPQPAAAAAASAAPAAGGAAAGAECMLRVRMDDGSQVTEKFKSEQSLGDVHVWVAQRRGDASFSLLDTTIPSQRKDLSDSLSSTLAALGFVPNASLTVQALDKKDMVSVAPEGATFHPPRPQVPMGMGGRFPPGMRGRGGFGGGMGGMGMGMGMGGMGMDGEDDEMEEDEDNSMDPEFVQAQSHSLDQAQEARFARAGAADMVREHSSNDFDLTGISVPEEFLDPLTQQIMRDPVVLPSSQTTMDRVTVLKHLMTQPTDPYTMTPLSQSMLKPAEELKGKIEAWIEANIPPERRRGGN